MYQMLSVDNLSWNIATLADTRKIVTATQKTL